MLIDVKLDEDFEYALEDLKRRYGVDFQILNGLHHSQLAFTDFIDGFIDKNVADASIDGNANAHHKDICSLLNECAKPEQKLFCFNKIFYEYKKKYGLERAKLWLELEWIGAFYLHDAASSSFKPYCYAYDLTRLATEGIYFLTPDEMKSKNYNNEAPKHLTTFIDDVIEFVSFYSNRTSGACGLPNVLLWTYYFWKHDIENNYLINDPDYYLRQAFQKLIFRLNQPFIRVDQSAFVNVSIFDHPYLEALFGGVEFPDGTFAIDCIDELVEHEKIFMEVVSATREKNMFTFPVLTYSLLKRDDITPEELEEMHRTKQWNIFKDNEFARWCSDHNTKWNDSNFFMSDNVGTLSNCCRLLSDTKKLGGFINSIGGTALSIGSVKVNTINLMKIAYETAEEDGQYDVDRYLNILRERTEVCCETLDVIRHIIKRNVEKKLLPNYGRGGIDMDKQYCTIGILGLYEVAEAFGFITTDEFGLVKWSNEGIEFASKVFEILNDVKDTFPVDYNFNIESVPAERAAVILCAKDNLYYNIRDEERFIYSNQWIPLSAHCSINEKLRVSSILDSKCSGGAIAHINLESNFPNTDSAWDALNHVASMNVIYFAFNTRINQCENLHAFVGTDTCPHCGGQVVDTWQRIVGFFEPVRHYSKDRKREFKTRYWYDVYKLAQESRDL